LLYINQLASIAGNNTISTQTDQSRRTQETQNLMLYTFFHTGSLPDVGESKREMRRSGSEAPMAAAPGQAGLAAAAKFTLN
jgi:hypothetical protein